MCDPVEYSLTLETARTREAETVTKAGFRDLCHISYYSVMRIHFLWVRIRIQLFHLIFDLYRSLPYKVQKLSNTIPYWFVTSVLHAGKRVVMRPN
jgi:hypothetical protein